MRCYICDRPTDRWPDSVCDKCLSAVNEDLRGDEADELPDLDIPYDEAFEPWEDEANDF